MVQSELVPQRISAPKPGAGRPDLSGSRETIPDLATWLQCFAVYIATVTAKEPDLTHNLLTYMVTIAKASMKYSWSYTIRNFHQEAADNGLKDWAKVDLSIYRQCFTNAAISDQKWCKNCQSIDHGSATFPLQSCQGSSSSTGGPSGPPWKGRPRSTIPDLQEEAATP